MNRFTLTLMATVLAASSMASSANSAKNTSVAPAVNYGSQLTLTSKILNQSRQLQVYLPDGYQTSARNYPVMVILDGQNYFLHGVTYQTNFNFVNKTPQFIVIGVNTDRRQRRTLFAHQADKFIDFMAQELMPFIEKNYRVSDERILFGWEMAGGLAAQELTQSQLFSAYLLASPTHVIEERIPAMASYSAKANKGSPYFYFTQSEHESFTDELEKTLQQSANKDFSWQSRRLIGDDHHSTPYRTIYQGLQGYFADYAPLVFGSLQQYADYGDMNKIKAHYKARGKRYGLSPQVHERTQFSLLISAVRENNYQKFDLFLGEFTDFVNNMKFPSWGDEWAQFYLKHQQYDKAHNVLIKALQQFPQSALLNANMGDALLGKGQKADAAQSYKKAIELAKKDQDPAVKEYQKKLSAL